ncbi:TetR/AcrR family transcriptional regulator [Pararhizobium mangrovi]|uniref:TetR/AcrR family transcriptional regulator n=1 Tax=Pararhizobium mangrovi TaxID=2590452 RepID=A0A506UHZ0_9HYPH|nr:TetR/AcrR family transcriptional regulator [Pararhizobium mangrovi]TPW32920.1 TetR/AcrR family transcriptional regulator [Pararhizobium mangrovi]
MDTQVRDETGEGTPRWGERQTAVLEAALSLLVEGGERALTTAGLARRANCSKESIYKWFDDRDGLLAAMVAFQAGKVRAPSAGERPMGREAFRGNLVTFAHDLLDVLAGEVSLAMNRLAIGTASREDARLGRLVLERGRRLIGIRAGALIEAGRSQGFIAYENRDDAFRTLYGLIVQDMHVRLLLGETLGADERDFARRASKAVDRFMHLYGSDAARGQTEETEGN